MTFFGIIITVAYVALIVSLRWSNLTDLQTMPLNELGDFLAGVFGPLMLLWLILGYIQQQKELRQNTKALELQADELKKSVEQHKELVKATYQQVETEMKALEHEQIKTGREAYPDFSITSAGLTMQQGQNFFYGIIIKNNGKPASSFSLYTEPKVKQINNLKFNSYFDNGQILNLKWESDKSGKAPENLKIVINCKDANTRPYSKQFDLVLGDKGVYHPVLTGGTG